MRILDPQHKPARELLRPPLTPQRPRDAAHDLPRTTGQPLDAATRAYMEPRFARDFSRVRVHADDAAGASARAFGSIAYTAGEHIVFAPGRYRPHADSGRELLGHELTHVVQQSDAPSTRPLVGRPGDALEAPAQRNATAVAAGDVAPAMPRPVDRPAAIQRTADPEREILPGLGWSTSAALGPVLDAAEADDDTPDADALAAPEHEVPAPFGDLRPQPMPEEPTLGPGELAPGAEGPLPAPRVEISKHRSTPADQPLLPLGLLKEKLGFLRKVPLAGDVAVEQLDSLAPKLLPKVVGLADLGEGVEKATEKATEAGIESLRGKRAPAPKREPPFTERHKTLSQETLPPLSPQLTADLAPLIERWRKRGMRKRRISLKRLMRKRRRRLKRLMRKRR